MKDPQNTLPSAVPVIEIVIKIAVLALLIGWCILILKPFITPVVWGVILAVAVYPLYHRLRFRLGYRSKLAAAIMSTIKLIMLRFIIGSNMKLTAPRPFV